MENKNSIVEDENNKVTDSASDELGNAIKETASYMAFRIKLAAVVTIIFLILAYFAGV